MYFGKENIMTQFDENKFYEQEQFAEPTTQIQVEKTPEKIVQTLKGTISKLFENKFAKIGAIIFLAFIVLIIAVACMNDPVQDDLLDYINNDLQSLTDLESEATDLYDAAREDTDSDYEMYLMIRDEVLPVARDWMEATEDIEVETEEVREVHEVYIMMVNENYNAMTLMLSALENQDYTLVSQANEKLNNARKLGRDFQSTLKKLMKEHDVVYE